MKRQLQRTFWPALSLSLALGSLASAQTPPKPGEALRTAISKGDLEAVKTVIESDATLVNGDSQMRSPLSYAIQSGKAEIVSFLLEKGADPNQDSYSQSPLASALSNYNGWKPMAEALLAKGAKINASDGQGQVPLHVALNYNSSSQKDKIAWLLANGADINIRNRSGYNALELALRNSSSEAFAQILAVADVKKTDDKGNTPLFTAVFHNKSEYVKQLLDKGSDVNAQNDSGDTVLHLAAARPGPILNLILGAGAKTDLKNHRGDIPLHVALRRDERANARPIAYMGDMTVMNVDFSETATPRGALIAPLTDKSDINARDQFGVTPLLLALMNRDQESRDIIMARAPKTDATTKLFDAVAQGDVVQTKALLTQKPFLVYFRLPDGTTPLHISALWGTLGVAQLLVQKGADVNARNSQGETPLHEALVRPTGLFARRSKNMVAFLLSKGANAGALDSTDSTPLHRAVKTESPELVEALLARKVNVNERDRTGQTPIFALMNRTSDIKVVQSLLSQGATVNIRPQNGPSLLSRAVQTKRKELVSLLLDKGADVNARDSEGRTALGSLMYSGGSSDSADVVALLLDKGADPNERIYGDTLIYRAISNDSKEVLKVLLASKKVNLKGTSERQSPLLQAISFGRTEMVGMLLDAGADPNDKDSQGRTALKLATDRSKELGDLLRAKGAKEG